MGNIQSRQRYYEVAYEALLNAQDLDYEYGGPPSQGAILAYIDGAISTRRMIRDCTPMEANEFYRLAEPASRRWTELNIDKFPCQPVRGRCQYPDEFLHQPNCRYRVQLPPGVEYPPLPGPHRGNGHHGQSGHPSNHRRSNQFGPPPNHRDDDRIHAEDYYGYSGSDDEYSDDEDEAVYSDEEDLYARSMSQASDYGFTEGNRRGGAGQRGTSRGGPNGAHGRATQGRAPNAGAARGDDVAAPSRPLRSGPSGAGATRGGDAAGPGRAARGDTTTAHGRAFRASRSGASEAGVARGDENGAAAPRTSRRGNSNAGAARSSAQGDEPPRQRNLRATVSDAVSEADFADNGIAAPRGGASRDGASHGGRRRRN